MIHVTSAQSFACNQSTTYTNYRLPHGSGFHRTAIVYKLN